MDAGSAASRREPRGPVAVARMRPEQQLEALARAFLPPGQEPLDEAALVGRVRRRVPHDEHERTAGVEPVGAQERLVLGPRASAPEDVRLRPAGDDDPACVDVVVAPEIVRHDVVLDDVAVAVGRDDSLADRVVPARDVRDNGELESTRRCEVRHDALRLHVGDDERSTVRAHRLEEPPRNVPAWAEEPPLHRALHPVGPRQPPLAGRVEHPVRVAGLHAVGVEAVAPVQPDRERVVAELPSRDASTRRSARSPKRPELAASSAPLRAGVSPRRSAHARASSAGTRNTPAIAPSSRSRNPSTIPVSKKTLIESRSGRTTQTRRVVTERGRGPEPRCDPRATPRRGRDGAAPRVACRMRASPRRRTRSPRACRACA